MKLLVAAALALALLVMPAAAQTTADLLASPVIAPVALAKPAAVAPVVVAPADSTTTTTVTTTSPSVTVPWGAWISSLIEQIVLPILAAVLLGILTWAAKFLPANLRAYATKENTAAVEQLLQKAISFGLNKVEGATAGQTLSIPVGSQVLANSAQYAIDHGPDWLLKQMGGEEGVREKILARLAIDPGANGAEVLAQAPPAIQ